jgi:polyisoprenoid-binding protein YceI
VKDHPQITFRSTELVQDGAAWRLRGQITARGTSAPAELTITEAAASEAALKLTRTRHPAILRIPPRTLATA